ncbi:MAG: hypothetical protein JSR54_11285 [Proteobacteria bacterium]|nr:hypothetical protein [Pseudomonadota bacterium]
MPAPALRLVLRILGSLAGAILALLLAVYALNAVDEDLTPAARALLAPPANLPPAADNLYLAFVGFAAPPGESPVHAGAARVAEYNARADALRLDPDGGDAFKAREHPGRLEFVGQTDGWDLVEASLWSRAPAERATIEAWRAANAELYRRYQDLRGRHAYAETAVPGPYAPAAYVSHGVRALFLADVALRLHSPALAARRAALDELAADLGVWHTVLAGSGALLGKLVAAANLHADLLVLGDLIGDRGADLAGLEDGLRVAAEPPPLEAWRVGGAFAAEMRQADFYLSAVPSANAPRPGTGRPAAFSERVWNVLLVHFFQLNATRNLDAEVMEHARALADGDPASLPAQRAQLRRWLDDRPPFHGVRWLYNPVGKALLAMGTPGYDGYPERVYDVAALQRLVRLALALRLEQVPAQGVERFMHEHPQWSTHPVGGTSFRWDPGQGQLSLDPVGGHPRPSRFALTLAGLARSAG